MKRVLAYKIFSLFMILFPLLTYGQYSADRIEEKSVPMSSQGELTVSNTFGNIILMGWDQDSVKMKVDVKVKKKTKGAAIDLLDRIETSITPFGSYVTIKTEIREKGNSFFEKLFNEINPLEFDKSDIDINYEIYLPKDASIEVSNDFGDIIITDWNGKLEVTLRHGDLKITEPVENAKLNVSFGNINARSIGSGVIDLKNGKLKVNEIDALRLQSSGSELTLESVGFLNIKSNKDELQLNKVDRLKAEVKFSTLFIDQVKEEIFLDLNLADIRIGKILNANTPIYIKQHNSEVDLNISGLTFNLSADMEAGILRLPSSTANLDTKMIDEKNKIRQISANYGAVGQAGKFILEGKKGYVILREVN